MTSINLDDLTIGQAKTLATQFAELVAQRDQAVTENADAAGKAFWQPGKAYLIRTVTMIDVGTLVAVTPNEIILVDASWIADTGRFSAALTSCEFNEVEPFPAGLVAVGRGSIIEAVQIPRVPRNVK